MMSEIEVLPKGWVLAKFDECCENISLNGIRIKQKQYLNSGKIPVIDQGRELIGGYFNDELLVVPNEPPYVVFGDHTKVKKFVTFKFIAGADGVKVLKPYDFILPKLFYYFIYAVKMPDKGYARHYQFLANSEFLIPPQNEQKRILAKLEQLLTDLDKGIEYLETAKQQLKVYRQAVLKWAFEGKLTNSFEIPLVTLSEVIEPPKYGTSKKCDYNTAGKGVLRIPNIGNGHIDSSDLKFALFEEDEEKPYVLLPGDILTIRSNGSVDLVGKCALITEKDKDFLYAGYLIRLRPKVDKILPKYLLSVLSSHDLRIQIESKAKSSSGVNNINSDELKSLIIPFPSKCVQEMILKEIESRLSVCDKIEETIESSLQQAEALRLSIIKKAFEGKLVPQDPNDEPAERLLERIRAAKGNGKNLKSQVKIKGINV